MSAKVVSGIAKAASRAPGIGDIASQAASVADTVSDVATAFGFSNEPNMADVGATQVKTFHAFANTEQSCPLDKLSLDPANSVSLSPSTAGLADVDEMAFSEFCAHESYLGSVEWNTSVLRRLIS